MLEVVVLIVLLLRSLLLLLLPLQLRGCITIITLLTITVDLNRELQVLYRSTYIRGARPPHHEQGQSGHNLYPGLW
jgi:hypothetical protein